MQRHESEFDGPTMTVPTTWTEAGMSEPSRPTGLHPRLLRRPLDQLTAEVRTLTTGIIGRRGRVPFFPLLGVLGCGLILGIAWLQHSHPILEHQLAGENASLALPLALGRLPGSMFAPALQLPLWGALAQVLFVFGLAEAHLGRLRTLAIIAVTHTAATVGGRFFVLLGPHAPLHMGLPRWNRWETDTGPSAGVVGVSTYLGVKLRLPILTSLLVGSMAIAMIISPSLAGREHLVAIATGGLFAAGFRVLQVVFDRPLASRLGLNES